MSKKGNLQINLEYAAARALLSGLGLLPRPLAVAAGRGIGRLAHAAFSHLRRTGERNLELAFPKMSRRERRRILRGCFDSLGRQLGEFSQFPRATAESLREIVEYDSDGTKSLVEARARGRGIIFVTAHLGAWELLCFAHSAFGDPLSFLVRPIDNPRIEEMVEGIRSRFGNRPIDKTAAAVTALRVLRQGGTLGILADLNTHPHEGVFVPFFGRLACTTVGVAAIALRAEATVLPVYAVWNNQRKRFVFCGGPILELTRTGNHQSDIEINTARITAAIEQQIRAYPDQWLWIHRRWKTRPEGEPDLYSAPGKSARALELPPQPTESVSKS